MFYYVQVIHCHSWIHPMEHYKNKLLISHTTTECSKALPAVHGVCVWGAVLFWSLPGTYQPGSRRVPAARLAGCTRVHSALVQGGACFQSGPEREDSPGKMATAGSADRPGRPAIAASGRTRARLGAGCGSSTQEDEVKKCPSCAEPEAGVRPPCGHPACPLCLARRHSGSEERLRRKSEPERSSSRPGRRDCDSRRGTCVYREKNDSYTEPTLGVRFTDEPQKDSESV